MVDEFITSAPLSMPKHGLLVCSINTSIVINVRNYRNGLISLATRNYLINVTILRSRPRRESQNRAKKETREGKLCWNTSAKKNIIVVQNYRLYSIRPAVRIIQTAEQVILSNTARSIRHKIEVIASSSLRVFAFLLSVFL